MMNLMKVNTGIGGSAYHDRRYNELYQQYFDEFRQTIDSAVEFLRGYQLKPKNIFRLISLIIDYNTDARYEAARTVLNEK